MEYLLELIFQRWHSEGACGFYFSCKVVKKAWTT